MPFYWKGVIQGYDLHRRSVALRAPSGGPGAAYARPLDRIGADALTAMSNPVLLVEPTDAKDLGPCPCCGNVTRRVWGYVHRGRPTEAAYFVEWTLGAVDRHGAYFDLIIGGWGERATASGRVAVSLAFRRTSGGPEFMVIDATERDIDRSSLVSQSLMRDEVLAGPFAARAFAIVDAVWLQDPRIAELTADAA